VVLLLNSLICGRCAGVERNGAAGRSTSAYGRQQIDRRGGGRSIGRSWQRCAWDITAPRCCMPSPVLPYGRRLAHLLPSPLCIAAAGFCIHYLEKTALLLTAVGVLAETMEIQTATVGVSIIYVCDSKATDGRRYVEERRGDGHATVLPAHAFCSTAHPRAACRHPGMSMVVFLDISATFCACASIWLGLLPLPLYRAPLRNILARAVYTRQVHRCCHRWVQTSAHKQAL